MYLKEEGEKRKVLLPSGHLVKKNTKERTIFSNVFCADGRGKKERRSGAERKEEGGTNAQACPGKANC